MKFSKIKPVLFLIGALIILSIVISYETTVVPEWKVKIVDTNNNPIAGVEVIQEWAHKTLEFGPEHKEVILSNENGEVIFPERTIRASLISRGVGAIVDVISIVNVHTTTGKFAIVHTKKDVPLLLYRDERELQHTLVIREW